MIPSSQRCNCQWNNIRANKNSICQCLFFPPSLWVAQHAAAVHDLSLSDRMANQLISHFSHLPFQTRRGRESWWSSVLMQRLPYLYETVLSNKITRNKNIPVYQRTATQEKRGRESWSWSVFSRFSRRGVHGAPPLQEDDGGRQGRRQGEEEENTEVRRMRKIYRYVKKVEG